MMYAVTVKNPAAQLYHVSLAYDNSDKDSVELKMSVWTPGFYSVLDFGKAVQNFKVKDATGKNISWSKPSKSSWRFKNGKKPVTVTYDVKADVSFVGTSFLDASHGYILPGGLFMYADDELKKPVTVKVTPDVTWKDFIATGLDGVPGEKNTFYAPDFDILFDSPLLMGNKIESLPPFEVNHIPHNFVGYDMGIVDRKQFMADLKNIVIHASDVIGEIPYAHYTFLNIGYGQGGIEHLNSSSLSFQSRDIFDSPEAKKQAYSFLAHEYFHHYNVKRIRPVELGPFDYSKENRTNMLWVSEGFTSYYEYLIIRRANLVSTADLLEFYSKTIGEYENSPGHLYQSATQSSYDTWAENPFGKSEESAYKTISYYDKGAILGLMLDFKIRHETKNKQSLDSLMKLLYQKYYKGLKRGFTEQEFQAEAEKTAGVPLTELFEYASTVKPVDYPKYVAYAGLTVDTVTRELPGAYLGITSRVTGPDVVISRVAYDSPAWKAGLHAKYKILKIDGKKPDVEQIRAIRGTRKAGDTIKLDVLDNEGKRKSVMVTLGTKKEKSFAMTPLDHPDALQKEIFESWLR